MTIDKEKYDYLRRCAMNGIMPSRTDLSFSDRLKYCQLRLLHEYPDDKKIEEVIGRSMKQLGRYVQGNDIPFLVLAKLCEFSRVPFEWVVENEVLNSKASSLPDFVEKFWNEPENVAEASANKGAEKAFINSEMELGNKELHTIKPDLFRTIGRLVVDVHKVEGVTLPPDALLDEQSSAYNALIERAEDPSDTAELNSLLPWLETRLKRKLSSAKAAPGTGKRPA